MRAFLLRRLGKLCGPIAMASVGLLLVLAEPAGLFGQGRNQEFVQPETVTALLQKLPTQSAGVQIAILQFFDEVANKPSDPLGDTYTLQITLRNAGPEIAKLAATKDSQLLRQVLLTLGRTRARAEVARPLWEQALAANSPEWDEVVAAGLQAYLKRLALIRDRATAQAQVAFAEAELADLVGVASLLPRLQSSRSAAARMDTYRAVAAFFEVLENLNTELRGDANPTALASAKQLLEQVPGKLQPFFAAVGKALPEASPEEAGVMLHVLEKVAETCVAQENFMQFRLPQRTVGRLLQPDLEPQGTAAARQLVTALQQLLPAIAGSLRSPSVPTRLAATNVLEAMNVAAVGALPQLLASSRDPNTFVRWACIRTLGKMSAAKDAPADRIVATLVPLLNDNDLGIRGVTALALELFGEHAAPAVPALSQLAMREDAALQLAALRALDAVGPAAAGAIPGMVVALRSQDERVREMVPVLLARLGRAAAPAVPALQRALTDSSPSVRLRAAEALVKIQVPDAGIQPAPVAP